MAKICTADSMCLNLILPETTSLEYTIHYIYAHLIGQTTITPNRQYNVYNVENLVQ